METESPGPSSNDYEDENIEIGILVTAKKMGLGFDELNLLNLNDYLTFVDKWVGEDGKTDGTPVRMATQADIDRYMG